MGPNTNIQKGESDGSSVRMEKFGKTEPHEPEADSKKKKKKTETISSILMKEQKVRLVPSIQKEEYDNSPVRVEESERTIEPEDSEFQRKKEIETTAFPPIKGQEAKPVAEIDEEKSKKHFAIKDQEKRKVRESIDLESDKLVWETLTEMEKPDNGAEIRNIQNEEIHPSGKTSAGHDDHGTKTHMSCRKDTKVESEPNDYSMKPPELTDSESEEESEEETEDDMLRSYRPSSFPTSRSAFIDIETSDASTDSSDEDTKELQIDKEMSKNRIG